MRRTKRRRRRSQDSPHTFYASVKKMKANERVQGQDIRGNNDRKKEGTERDEETGSGNEMKSRTNEREKSRGRNSEGYRKRWEGCRGIRRWRDG